ncbi:hypothetical protein SNEBB_001065 [Seison nebaliae]|nr:hypothetical protein SNEBB_001065 [Seison nebaliae]
MFSRSNDAKGEQLRDIYFNGETITESLPVAKEKNNKRIEELMSQLAIEKDSTILTAYLDETSLEIRNTRFTKYSQSSFVRIHFSSGKYSTNRSLFGYDPSGGH